MGDRHTAECWDCGHKYDTRDQRGYFKESDRPSEQASYCPLCWQDAHGGAPAWALWNSCNGIFADAIFHTRKEALDCLNKSSDPKQFDAVVPVRVHKIDGHARWLREQIEEDYERLRSGAAAE